MRYPQAPVDDVVDVLHATLVPDPYRWLEDASSEPTRSWSQAQDELAREILDVLPGRDALRTRLEKLVRVGVVSAPAPRGGRLFFFRRSGDQEHAVFYVREPAGGERALIDPAALDPGLTTTLDFAYPSLDGARLAYGLSRGGDEESVLHVMDVETGADLGLRIDRTRYTPVGWLPGGEAFYYVRRLPPDRVPEGEEQFHRRVFLHRIGTDPDADDVEIFGADRDHRSYHSPSVSADGRWLVIHTQIGTDNRNDAYIADLDGDGQLRPIVEGRDGLTYAYVVRGRLYVMTNLDAPKWRVCVADPSQPTAWRDVIPESDAVLSQFTVAGDAVVVNRTRDVVSHLTIHDGQTGAEICGVDLPTKGSAVLTDDPEAGDDVYFTFTSFGVPLRAFRLHVPTRRLEIWAEAPGSPQVEGLAVEQVFATSADGTRVPMFVISLDGTPRDGTAPAVLYGYGGFNNALTPFFLGGMLAAVEAGCVFAVANLRGGSEYGEDWHRAGMLGNKQNVFDDFVACAEHLISQRIVAPGRLGIYGGSNGGLLVGAALTQRPDLFRAVVCAAPLLDMVRYEHFGLGCTWNVEYGSVADPDAFRWLHAYSPYHRVVDGSAYPSVLFKTYESDSRVDPLHARKMCARLQAATASERPVILRRETKAGHAGKAISRVVDDLTDTFAYLFHELGVATG